MIDIHDRPALLSDDLNRDRPRRGADFAHKTRCHKPTISTRHPILSNHSRPPETLKPQVTALRNNPKPGHDQTQEVDLIMVLFNDGAYGAEHIQFTARGMDASHTTHSWPDFAQVAVAMGGDGITVNNIDDFATVQQAIASRTRPLLIDIMIDPPDHR